MPTRPGLGVLISLLIGAATAGCYIDAPPASPHVISAQLDGLLTDPDPEVRRTAAEALGKIGYREAGSSLLGALNDGDARVRAAASLALGRLGESRSGTALARALSDPAETVRANAALALGEIEASSTREAQILAVLREGTPSGREAAARALLGLETVSFSPDLVAGLRSPEPAVRQGVAAALGETGDERVIQLLLALVKKDSAPGVRAEAAFRLGKLGDGRVVGDVAAVAESDSNVTVRDWARWAADQIRHSHGSGSTK
ncbi:HEAT repeat domain-containing protein [Nitrospirales bacterium NOB]|nr:MAG: putative lyase [Nitrospira sp. OLB3]MBV6468999.1 hypothetical protein [Nitrospirota bacterium]MCE7966379.1 HEAT repeat domain-containing protein [Nitrospira sp. NTP2]MDL1888928.1 HEAT repeat domain-containing protein [Nitrospirales bacterium NOB]QOJ35281.1 MAG: HEAT repeat domain-containing protein [Nitrospira sp.]